MKNYSAAAVDRYNHARQNNTSKMGDSFCFIMLEFGKWEPGRAMTRSSCREF